MRSPISRAGSTERTADFQGHRAVASRTQERGGRRLYGTRSACGIQQTARDARPPARQPIMRSCLPSASGIDIRGSGMPAKTARVGMPSTDERDDGRRRAVDPEHLAGQRVLDAADRVRRAQDDLRADRDDRRAAHDRPPPR